jgi:hypothetical protein
MLMKLGIAEVKVTKNEFGKEMIVIGNVNLFKEFFPDSETKFAGYTLTHLASNDYQEARVVAFLFEPDGGPLIRIDSWCE